MFLSMCAYSIYVGGDAWEAFGGANRYICVVMPIMFVLMTTGLWTLLTWLKRGHPKEASGNAPINLAINIAIRTSPPEAEQSAKQLPKESFTVSLAPFRTGALTTATAALAGLSSSPAIAAEPHTSDSPNGSANGTDIKSANGAAEAHTTSGSDHQPPGETSYILPTRPARQHESQENLTRNMWAILRRGAVNVFDIALIFALVGFIDLPSANFLTLTSPNPGDREQWNWITPPLHSLDSLGRIDQGLKIKEITLPEARVAVSWAGIAIYFADRPGVDLLGKSDRVIARAHVSQCISIR
jgi:hypothetical protein